MDIGCLTSGSTDDLVVSPTDEKERGRGQDNELTERCRAVVKLRTCYDAERGRVSTAVATNFRRCQTSYRINNSDWGVVGLMATMCTHHSLFMECKYRPHLKMYCTCAWCECNASVRIHICLYIFFFQ
jgi:hypothetical protein